MGEQAQPAAEHDELAAHRPDGLAVVLPEVGDGLEVRRQPPGQPHHLHIAPRLPLQPPAGLHPVEVAVEIELQHQRRMVGRPPRPRRDQALEPQRRQVQLVDEHIDHPHLIVLANIVFQAVGQQRPLHPVLALNKAVHRKPPCSPAGRFYNRISRIGIGQDAEIVMGSMDKARSASPALGGFHTGSTLSGSLGALLGLNIGSFPAVPLDFPRLL